MCSPQNHLRLVIDNSGRALSRVPCFIEELLEGVVGADSEPTALLDPCEKPGVVEDDAPKFCEGDVFFLAEVTSLLQKLAAKRGVFLIAHVTVYEGYIRHMSNGKFLRASKTAPGDTPPVMNEKLLQRLDHAFIQAGNPSRREVARLAGLEASYFADIYSGKIKSPRTATLEKIAEALKVDPEWLAYGKGEPGQRPAPPGYADLPDRERALVDALSEELASRYRTDQKRTG